MEYSGATIVAPSSGSESEPSNDRDVMARPRMHDAHAHGQKVGWSDDDSDGAYTKFRNGKNKSNVGVK